jgi:hypothetical protein
MDKNTLDRLRQLAGNAPREQYVADRSSKNMYQIRDTLLESSTMDRARYDADSSDKKKVTLKKAPWEKDKKEVKESTSQEYETETGRAIADDEGIDFDNSGYTTFLTWDELATIFAGGTAGDGFEKDDYSAGMISNGNEMHEVPFELIDRILRGGESSQFESKYPWLDHPDRPGAKKDKEEPKAKDWEAAWKKGPKTEVGESKDEDEDDTSAEDEEYERGVAKARRRNPDFANEAKTEADMMREWANSVYQQYDDKGTVQEQPEGETVDLSLRRYLNAQPQRVAVQEDIQAGDLLREYKDFKKPSKKLTKGKK